MKKPFQFSMALLKPGGFGTPLKFILATTAAMGAIAGGALLRREFGNMTYGAMYGVIGWQASPSRATGPSVQRGSGSRSNSAHL